MEDLKPSSPTASGHDPGCFDTTAVITPELALVDPDAAAAARAALPDRPWEVALARALADRPAPALAPTLAPAPDFGGDPVALVRSTAPEPLRDDVDLRPPRVGVAAARRLVFALVWAVMITSVALLAEVRHPDVPVLGAEAASVPSRGASLPTPVPGAGYVIGAKSGFRIGPQGRAIGALVLPVECLWDAPLGRIAIGVDKTFSFRGTTRRADGRRVRVWLTGRFTGPRRAVGSVTVRGRGCVRRTVTFVARLS